MSVTGIVAALTAEARTLGAARPDAHSIQTLRDGSLLCISGMGPAAAAQAAHNLIRAGADTLLSFGLAGALDPQLRAGAVVLPEAVIDEAGFGHATHAPWRQRLVLLARDISGDPMGFPTGGTLLGVARPLTSVAAKSQAWRSTGACAVDMESFAIGAVATEHSLPFAVARVVIDLAADTLPGSVTAATDARGAVSLPRLAAGLMGAPSDIVALMRLARRHRAAMRALRYLGARGVAWS